MEELELQDNSINEEFEELSVNTQARRWILTINNPTETDEEMEQYISNLEHIKYAMFQRERGGIEGTVHFQIFVTFSIGKRWKTVKGYFPRAHIEQAKGSNLQCRDYCSKKDTRVSGPYEIGQFAEERARTNKQGFLQAICSGLSEQEIKELYPSLYLDKYNDIAPIFRKKMETEFKNKWRHVEVTYIWGPSRSGKTRFVLDRHDRDDIYRVTLFNNSAFDSYLKEDVLLFDEFDSSFKITDMNNYLDGYYVALPARYGNRFTLYTKAYIISNLPLSKQYMDVQERKPEIYDAFVKRIHNIIRIDDTGVHVEKGCVQGIQQEMELKELSKEEAGGLPW